MKTVWTKSGVGVLFVPCKQTRPFFLTLREGPASPIFGPSEARRDDRRPHSEHPGGPRERRAVDDRLRTRSTKGVEVMAHCNVAHVMDGLGMSGSNCHT